MQPKRYMLAIESMEYIKKICADSYLPDTLPKRKRYIVSEQNIHYEIEYFLENLEGLVLVNIHCEEAYELNRSPLFASLSPYILEDITGNIDFEDESLLQRRKPPVYRLEQHIALLRSYEASNLFFWQVPKFLYTDDALKLVLFKNLRLFSYYKESYLSNDATAPLHRLRIIAFRQYALIDLLMDHPEKIYLDSKNYFIAFYEDTKDLRYLYFLEELWSNERKKSLRTIQILSEKKATLRRQLCDSLTDKENFTLINNLYASLTAQDKHRKDTAIKKVPAVLNKELSVLHDHLRSLKKNFQPQTLWLLYRQLISIETIIEEFYHFYNNTSIRQLVETLDILVKPLRRYLNCRHRKALLKRSLPTAHFIQNGYLQCSQDELSQHLKLIRHAIAVLSFEVLHYDDTSD